MNGHTFGSAETPVIEVHGLFKSFASRQRGSRVRAIDGLDLEVRRSETFGLLGADGAGKTTTLRLMNGLLRPDSGAVRVAGYDTVTEFRRIHRRVGYMPQQFALYGDMTVSENLGLFADLYGLTRAQKAERIPRLLRFARLGQFGGRRA